MIVGSTILMIGVTVVTAGEGDRDRDRRVTRERGPKNKLRSGDWWCSVCQCINLASRKSVTSVAAKRLTRPSQKSTRLLRRTRTRAFPRISAQETGCAQFARATSTPSMTHTKCDNTTMKPTDGGNWGVLMESAAAPVTEDATTAQAGGDNNDAAQSSVAAPEEEPVVAEAT